MASYYGRPCDNFVDSKDKAVYGHHDYYEEILDTIDFIWEGMLDYDAVCYFLMKEYREKLVEYRHKEDEKNPELNKVLEKLKVRCYILREMIENIDPFMDTREICEEYATIRPPIDVGDIPDHVIDGFEGDEHHPDTTSEKYTEEDMKKYNDIYSKNNCLYEKFKEHSLYECGLTLEKFKYRIEDGYYEPGYARSRDATLRRYREHLNLYFKTGLDEHKKRCYMYYNDFEGKCDEPLCDVSEIPNSVINPDPCNPYHMANMKYGDRRWF